MRMNDQTPNAVTQLFAWIAAFASAVGITTQDVVYMIFGLVGVIVSLASFFSGRLDARRFRLQDEKRTELLEKYLEDIHHLPPEQRPTSAQVVAETISRISADAK
ncbi:hypothetical protein [Cedecea lapagei]|uniref:hypothetical protein n=1 Tax=Cedecea lapagei TaxID=158823 RepID=UPI001BCCA2D3|nr:hypothetical protein [Cedecea lapagei]